MKPSYEMSADARLLYQRLREAHPGETINHSDLEAAVSRPLSRIRGALATAIRRVLRDDGMVFANVRGVGYIRCQDEAIIDLAGATTTHIRRAARRSVEKLTKVESFATLPPNKQIEYTTRMTLASAIATMTTEKSADKLRKVAAGRSELPFADTIKAFLS